jgi:hypothetical protein
MRAVVVSSLAPFLLEGLDRWVRFLPEQGPSDVFLFSFLCPGMQPRTVVLLSVVVHLYLALVPWVPPYRRESADPVLSFASHLLRRSSAAVLCFTAPLLATVWALAFSPGLADLALFTEPVVGNHGPWCRVYDLNRLLISANVEIPLAAVVLAALSWSVRPTRKGFGDVVALAGCAYLIVLAIAMSHYWLID